MVRNKSPKKYAGILYVLIAAAMWGAMGVFVRYFDTVGLMALDMTQIRVTGGLLVIGIYLLLFRRDLFVIRLKDLWCFLGTGIVSLLLFSTCYFQSMKYVDLSVSAVLLYTAPIFVMLMSIFLFKEKVTWVKLCALVCALLGCVLVSGIGGERIGEPIGIALAIGSGFFYALYSIFSRFAIQRGYSSLTIVFYTFLFCCIGCAFLADWGNISSVVFTYDAKNWIYCIGVGVITGFFPYVFYSRGLEMMESSKASILASLEPVVATLFGMLLFGEYPSPLGYVGIVLVLGAVVMLSVNPKRK